VLHNLQGTGQIPLSDRVLQLEDGEFPGEPDKVGDMLGCYLNALPHECQKLLYFVVNFTE